MWNDVLGHEGVKSFLSSYLHAQERPHALLFLGAAGLGKKRLALEFAKTLLCENSTGVDDCESCRLMNLEDGNFSHPDFILLEQEQDTKTGRIKDIGIDQVRELTGKAAFAPVMSQNKVCIIDGVDSMTVYAANSFLKLLEEPPAGWVIILLAESEDKLLTTILSRVVKVRFQPIPEELVYQALLERGVAKEQALVLARISEGSLGAAVRLLKQQVFEVRQQAVAFLEALPLKMPMDYVVGRPWVEKYDRNQAILFVKLLQLLLRDLLIIRADAKIALYNCDIETGLQQLSRGWSSRSLKQALDIIKETYAALDSSVGVKLAQESMALKIDSIYKE